MPGPMPPGAPPPAPQGPPPGGAPPDQGDAGGGMSQLLQHVDQAIDHIAQVVSQAQDAPPEAKQLIAHVDDMFGQFMDMIGGGGGGDEQGPPSGAQGQPVPPEAGGNKGAVPA